MTALTLRVPADCRAPGRVRAELKDWLAARGWPGEDADDLVLAVSEAVSNAAEHAYLAGRAVDKDCRVVLVTVAELAASDARQLKVVVEDFGVWRPVPPDPGSRGRGLRMIGALTESCEVTQRSSGTTVTIISNPINAGPPPPFPRPAHGP